jgi:hypothetical protein
LVPSGSPDVSEQRAILGFFTALFRGAVQLRRTVVEVYETALMDHRDSHRQSPFLVTTALSVLFYIVEQTVPLLPVSGHAFVRAVLPLFADEQMTFYVASLERLIGFFLDDRPSHGTPVVRALLAAFPTRGVRKQKAILELLGNALDRPIKFSQDLAVPVARVLILAGESQSVTVAQTGLRMWVRVGVDRVLADQRRLIVPLAVPSLSAVMDTHWSYDVRQAAKSCLAYFQRRDGRIVQECLIDAGPSFTPSPQMKNWVSVVKTAQASDESIDIGGLMQQILRYFKPAPRVEDQSARLLTLSAARASSERTYAGVMPLLI